MGYLTGEQAAIDGVTCLRRFRVRSSAVPAVGYCSASVGGPVVAKGNEDDVGVASAYGGQPTRLPGETFTFSGADRDGSGITGPAIVTKIEVNAQVEGAELLSHFVWFAQQGSGGSGWTFGSVSVTDSSTPAPASSKALAVKINGSDFNVRRYKFTLENKPAIMRDSGTGGFTGRAIGNYSGAFELLAWYSDHAALPTRGTFNNLFFETVANGAGWQMDNGYIEHVNPDVHVEGDPPEFRAKGNTASITGIWSAYAGTVQGTVVAPDSTIWFPA